MGKPAVVGVALMRTAPFVSFSASPDIEKLTCRYGSRESTHAAHPYSNDNNTGCRGRGRESVRIDKSNLSGTD